MACLHHPLERIFYLAAVLQKWALVGPLAACSGPAALSQRTSHQRKPEIVHARVESTFAPYVKPG
jgi:hypothetical protein